MKIELHDTEALALEAMSQIYGRTTDEVAGSLIRNQSYLLAENKPVMAGDGAGRRALKAIVSAVKVWDLSRN